MRIDPPHHRPVSSSPIGARARTPWDPTAVATVLLAMALSACGPATTTPAAPVVVAAPAPAPEPTQPLVHAPREVASPTPTASSFTLDGFQLGDGYGDVMRRAPYDHPCDNDPIDNRARRFMVYGALPCRGTSFPRGTTVAFFIRHAETDRYEQPIEAFAWLGGDYFSSRADFPLPTSVDKARADAVLGEPEQRLELQRADHRLVARRHSGQIYSLAHGEAIVGYVLGAMPTDAENEQWRGLMQMYVRYTLRPDAQRPVIKDVAPCCMALRGSASAAAPEHQGPLLAAAAACDSFRESPVSEQQFNTTIQGVLHGAPMPQACR